MIPVRVSPNQPSLQQSPLKRASQKLWAKLSAKRNRMWIGLGLAAFVALQVYYVQEMLAALAIFCVLFVFVAFAVLIGFALDRASQRTVAWAEPGAARVAKVARRGRTFAEEAFKKNAPTDEAQPLRDSR